MKINAKIKKVGIISLVIAIGVSLVAISQVFAAKPIDVNAECSIDFSVPAEMEGLAELSSVPAKLYKVASVDAGAKYSLEDTFSSVSGIESVTDETTAAEWKNFASQAFGLINDSVVPAKEFNFEKGKVTVSTGVGLYLVVIDQVVTPTEVYSFEPYLISLPGNSYYETGNDDWIYLNNKSIVKSLKEDRFGPLTIEKTIDTFNLTLGDATCVFKVEATKNYGTNANPDIKTVYSDVVAIDFSEAGTKSYTIENLPAGATVTVTEIYSGGSYKASGALSFKTEIIALDKYSVSQEGTEVATAKVSFVNTYDDELKTNGTALVNSFKKTGDGWDLEVTNK